MDDNNLNNNNLNNNKVNTYHATSNLNTAIENPQINVNSATGINIKDSGYNNYAENNINNNTNFLNNNFNQPNNNINQTSDNDISSKYVPNNDYNNYNSYSNQNTENYSYEPVMKEKKKEKNALSGTIHSKEFKVMIFIVFILILFLLLMPYIYDLFRELSMSMTA